MSLGQFALLYLSMHLGMPPGTSALVLQAQVPLTIVIAAVALREPPSRAQAAGVVRPDVEFMDVARMVFGIAAIPASDPDQITRILDVALDGLRYRPA